MILAIRTDTAVATLVVLDQSGSERGKLQWEAGRQLSSELLAKIKQLLESQDQQWSDLKGLIVYRGPGSFTGLRIGVTVANTIGFVLKCPIAGAGGDTWLQEGLTNLKKKRAGDIVLPHYGAEANITRPKR